jgi:hypothetical protein
MNARKAATLNIREPLAGRYLSFSPLASERRISLAGEADS